MARRRKAERKRNKNGRLSRARENREPELRDLGTPQVQDKRLALVGEGGDPTLSATLAGILFARGHLDQDQYNEAIEYARLHAMVHGQPFANGTGVEVSEDALIRAQELLAQKDQRLSQLQRNALVDVCHGNFPRWSLVPAVTLAAIPAYLVERALLLSGLDALVAVRRRRAA
jgi:hypothetical protein